MRLTVSRNGAEQELSATLARREEFPRLEGFVARPGESFRLFNDEDWQKHSQEWQKKMDEMRQQFDGPVGVATGGGRTIERNNCSGIRFAIGIVIKSGR